MTAPVKASTGAASKVVKTAVKAAAVSSEKSFMPWEGWLSRAVQKGMGDELYSKMRNVFLFRPEDGNFLEQQPRPNQKFSVGADPKNPTFVKFRYPSPGSQSVPNVPKSPVNNDPYDISYYSRDTRRRERETFIGVSDKAGAEYVTKHGIQLIESPTEAIGDGEKTDSKFLNEIDTVAARVKLGSPGNKGNFATGPSGEFNEGATALRATMSTNHEITEASLDAHMPTQLPTSTWMKNEDDILAIWKEKGLPPQLGLPHRWKLPKHAKMASW